VGIGVGLIDGSGPGVECEWLHEAKTSDAAASPIPRMRERVRVGLRNVDFLIERNVF